MGAYAGQCLVRSASRSLRRFQSWAPALLPVFFSTFLVAEPCPGASRPPNVVVIVSDDAGYGDFGFQGSREVQTPHIDSIAERGVRFTQAYVTASTCSPSRAGLMTGRYQQRFGHELNIPPRWSESNGLPTSERTLANALADAGYRTIGVGKWHLGYARPFQPLSRGFDDFFGFLKGTRSYWSIEGDRLNRLLRNRVPVTESFEYLTDELGEQAARYIEVHKGKPFFLYLSFNAVHTPMQAKRETLAAVRNTQHRLRKKLIAMTISMDDAVGRVLTALEVNGLTANTLLFFVNDNGGASNNGSDNRPLRGHKGTPFEGGIRVPFLVQWPGVVPAGATYEPPVSTLDIVPTALSAARARPEMKEPLDGVDLLPFLTGEKSGRPHATLYWRRGPNSAVRDGDWKAVRASGGPWQLFKLDEDPSEQDDLAGARPEVLSRLESAFEAWNSQLSAPRWVY